MVGLVPGLFSFFSGAPDCSVWRVARVLPASFLIILPCSLRLACLLNIASVVVKPFSLVLLRSFPPLSTRVIRLVRACTAVSVAVYFHVRRPPLFQPSVVRDYRLDSFVHET